MLAWGSGRWAVVVQYSKLLQPLLSRHAMLLLLCWGRVLRDETKQGCEGSTEVTRRFNRYFINDTNIKKKNINIIIIININTDNNNNNNSNEDLDQLLITEPARRYSEIITLCVRKVITICVERLLHFALKILLHFASMLLHFALVLHFAAIFITFCGVTG